jgi:demethylmenaquinone methyltransferase/2-methoxy-6-polyprenyl-1,4-benzoquinol methylase
MAPDSEKGIYVRHMFARIADQYDLINRLMTGGFDIRWRKEVVRRSRINAGARVLDLGSGTGDIARDAIDICPDSTVVGGDFTITMMRVGQAQADKKTILWTGCDAQHLPFMNGSFDAVVSGFLLRNVSSVEQSLREQWRVLTPGGRIVALDTTRPADSMLTPVIRFYLNRVIPLLGGLISKDPEAYRYLPASTSSFLSAEQLAARFKSVGFDNVGFERKMFGTIAIHWGSKPFEL